MAKDVPIIKYRGKLFYWKENEQIIQNVEDPSDFISFSSINTELLEEP